MFCGCRLKFSVFRHGNFLRRFISLGFSSLGQASTEKFKFSSPMTKYAIVKELILQKKKDNDPQPAH